MSTEPLPRDLVISGPTASGKSGLGISLARELGAEIINLDSVQVYREADIGSAKLTLLERENIPHHLIDIIQPNESMHAAQFVELAEHARQEIRSRGQLPILVGGSTMYLTAYLHGLCELPAASAETRAELDQLNDEALFCELQLADPASAAVLHPNDRMRVARALEVFREYGVRASEVRSQHGNRNVRFPALVVVLCWERATLYERINARVRQMVRAGLVEETRAIIEKFGSETPLLQCIGYQQAKNYLDGQLTEEGLIDDIAMYTRRYAKRQMTFWRNAPEKLGWGQVPARCIAVKASAGTQIGEHDGVGTLVLRYRELSERLRSVLSSVLREDVLREDPVREARRPVEVWYVDAETILASV